MAGAFALVGTDHIIRAGRLETAAEKIDFISIKPDRSKTYLKKAQQREARATGVYLPVACPCYPAGLCAGLSSAIHRLG